jgi:hypothetical protein
MSAVQTKAKVTMNQLVKIIADLRAFIGPAQMQCLGDACRGEERDYFKAKLVEMAELIERMPRVYQQEGLGDQAIVHLHYFTGSADWWITERDTSRAQHQAYGLADLYQDGGEMGYISIVELIRHGAELDLHWTAKPLAEVRAEKQPPKFDRGGKPVVTLADYESVKPEFRKVDPENGMRMMLADDEETGLEVWLTEGLDFVVDEMGS